MAETKYLPPFPHQETLTLVALVVEEAGAWSVFVLVLRCRLDLDTYVLLLGVTSATSIVVLAMVASLAYSYLADMAITTPVLSAVRAVMCLLQGR